MIKTNFAVLMAERGLKIADVYEDTGISKTTLMALSDNTGKGVQFDTVDKLCNYLDIELKDFFVYIPYIWKMYAKEKYEHYGNDKNIFTINLKTSHSEKNYIIQLYFFSPKYIDFPIDDDSIKLWVRLSLDEDSADYGYKEFYNFVSSLPVSFQTHFYNDLVDILKQHFLLANSTVTVQINDYHPEKDHTSKVTLEKGDKILVSFFDNYGSVQAPDNIKRDKIIKLT